VSIECISWLIKLTNNSDARWKPEITYYSLGPSFWKAECASNCIGVETLGAQTPAIQLFRSAPLSPLHYVFSHLPVIFIASLMQHNYSNPYRSSTILSNAPDFRKHSITFSGSPVCPSGKRATCRWRLVWSVGTVIQPGEIRRIRRNPSPSAEVSTPNLPRTGLL